MFHHMASYSSSPVLFLYDSIITLFQEVNVIWCRRWTATTWLYAFTRYSMVLDVILHIAPTKSLLVSRILHNLLCSIID